MNTQVITSRERQQQARNRALDRAQAQAHLGNLPTLIATRFDGTAIHETWRVMSRTYAGVAYTVELSHDRTGIETLCQCPAAERGLICWHRGLARLAHTDAIACRNEAGMKIRPRVAS